MRTQGALTFRALVAAALIWLGTSPALPAAATATGPYDVPLTITAYGLVYVPLRVQGSTVLALVDTGSSLPLQISNRLARRLHLPLHRTDEVVSGYDFEKTRVYESTASLALGSFAQDDVAVQVAGDTLERTASLVGTRFDAVIGWGFLRDYYTLIDYRLRRFRFGPAPFAGDGYRLAMRFREVQRAPIVDGEVDGKPTALLLDTGAPTCSLDAATFALPMRAFVQSDVTVAGSTLHLRTLARDMTVNRPQGIAGILGTNLLDRYAVAIDPHDGVVEFF